MSEIFKAINAVMNEVGYVQKKRSGGVNYSFAGEAALIEALRPEMVKNGLFVFPTAVRETMTSYTTAKGSVMNQALLVVTYRFAHISGETFDVQVTGEGADIGDKSFNKAMTGAYKYALRQTFCIETGDDPDKHPSDSYEREAVPPVRGAGVPKPAPKVNGQPFDLDKWYSYTLSQIGRYDNKFAVDNALGKLGRSAPATRDEGLATFAMLEQYARYRDAGKADDEAVELVVNSG